MSSIDYHLQDFIFHQLIQKKKFEGWKTPWKTTIRDLKPFWIFKKSEEYLRSKGIFLDEYTERLTRLKNKNKNVNLFGNINTENKFVTLEYQKDEFQIKAEKAIPKKLKEEIQEDTVEIGIFQ